MQEREEHVVAIRMADSGSAGAASRLDLAADALRKFGRVELRVTGASMIPSIWPGDIVTVERQETAPYLEGDIVLRKRDGLLCIHRVVGERFQDSRAVLITRGDSNSYDDSPLPASDVLGKVVSIQRGHLRLAPCPRLTSWERLLAALGRRSHFCTRVLVRLHRLRWGARQGRATPDGEVVV